MRNEQREPAVQIVLVDLERLLEASKALPAAAEEHAFGMVLLIAVIGLVVIGIFGLAKLVWNWRRSVSAPCAGRPAPTVAGDGKLPHAPQRRQHHSHGPRRRA